jgi:hypothetical protein
MTDLSPAAQAVLDAYHKEAIDYIESWGSFSHKRGMAAALRTVANQFHPDLLGIMGDFYSVQSQLRTIASELEAM